MKKYINTNLFDRNGNYIYQGVELTPTILSRLMLKLCNGKRFSRQEALDTAINYHLDHGGYASRPSYVDTFKSVTNKYLSDYMENIVRNTWILNFCLDPDMLEFSDLVEKDNISQETKTENSIGADEVMGEGSECVYVYYYDTYQKYAISHEADKWPCKIGMTSSSYANRILSQSGTAMPECPHVGLAIFTDDAKKLEAMIHNCLRYRKAETAESPGNEWFTTNIQEIKQLYLSMCA